MHIRHDECPRIEEPDNGLVTTRLVNREEHWSVVSASWVTLNGRHHRLRNDHSDRIYVIIEGTARFEIDGVAVEGVSAGDAVTIPRGTPYELEGEVTYIVIGSPAVRREDNIYLDGPRAPEGGPPPPLLSIERRGSE